MLTLASVTAGFLAAAPFLIAAGTVLISVGVIALFVKWIWNKGDSARRLVALEQELRYRVPLPSGR